MKLETILNYVTHHSESIIQWLFLAILVFAGLLIARGLFGRKTQSRDADSEASASHVVAGPSPELQATLDKILAQTAKLEGVSVQATTSAGAPDVAASAGGSEAEVAVLKAQLLAREDELQKLRAASPAAAASENASDVAKRIKELEAKLAEYEILEDDIADLSLYKEENARLKAELDAMKAGGAAAVPAASTVVSGSAAPAVETVTVSGAAPVAPEMEAVSGEAIIEEFAQAVAADPGAAEALSGPPPAMPDTGNPMADFESTVQLEKQIAATPATAATDAAAAEPTAPAKPVLELNPTATAESDDLFAEFASAPPDGEDGSTLDTDKMMQEMASLVNMEPASGNALEEDIDLDKMASEVQKS